MIVNLKEILYQAKENKYAVGSFNIYSYTTIKGVMNALQSLELPGIIAFGEKYFENMDLEEVVALVKLIDKKSEKTPVAIHLDHCKSINHIIQAIQAGFTSVMYDGSDLDYIENVMKTKKVVDMAHAANVSVEAELGSLALGTHSNEDSAKQIYTDPEQAKDFIEKTSVDALAVSIGTVHGMYKGDPKINVDVLKNINNNVNIPLVLHGGSGTPENVILECIKNGICKINVNTEISMNVVKGVSKLVEGGKYLHLSKIELEERDLVEQVVSKYAKMFSRK